MEENGPIFRVGLLFYFFLLLTGLAASIRLKQLAAEKGTEIDVCVVEKGSAVGAHILSGNVFDPIALNELLPDWKERGVSPLLCLPRSNQDYISTKAYITYICMISYISYIPHIKHT